MGLDANWEPSFGLQYTWFGMDKQGRIGSFINNCFGNIPKKLLAIPDIEALLDALNEVSWAESKEFPEYWQDKNGEAILDLYSHAMFKSMKSKNEVFADLNADFKNLGQLSMLYRAAQMGLFCFEGIEGPYPGADYPVGYNGETTKGDYFRFLKPTIFASISDIPPSLRKIICVSDQLDFSQTQLIKNTDIDGYFNKMYEPF